MNPGNTLFLFLSVVLALAPLLPAVNDFLAGNMREYVGAALGLFSLLGLWLLVRLDKAFQGMRALSDLRARSMRNVLERTRDGFFEADMNGKVLRVNEALARLLGETPEALAGGNLWERLVPEGASPASRLLRAEGRRVRAELRLRREGMAEETLEAELVLEADALGRRFIQGLVRSRREREDAGELRRQITLNVCRAVQLGLERWDERLLSLPPEKAARFRGSLNRAFDSLAAVVINDNFKKFRPPMFFERLNLVPVLVGLVQDMDAVARLRGQYIENHIEGAEIPADADAEALYTALRHLLANALRATPAGRTVRFEARAADGQVQCHVVDHGAGLLPSEADGLFQPFSRAESGDGRFRHGLGLGLWLARVYAEAHGGSVEALPEPGAGVRMGLRFPQYVPTA